MKMSDVQNLPPGIYRIFWKTGGSSLASVGCDKDGKRWLAPTNWLLANNVDLTNWHKTWRRVEKAKLALSR